MKKVIVFLFIFLILVGCSNEAQSVETENEQVSVVIKNKNAVSDDEQSQKQQDDLLSEDAAMRIVRNHFYDRRDGMKALMDAKKADGTYELLTFSDANDAFEKYEQEVKEAFEPLFTKEKLGLYAEVYAEMYTCACDSYYVFEPYRVDARFKLVDQDSTQFSASFLQVGNWFYDEAGGIYTVHFIKEDDIWKFQDYTVNSGDDQALNITPKELERSFYENDNEADSKMEFLEYREIDGVETIVMRVKYPNGEYGKIAYAVMSGREFEGID